MTGRQVGDDVSGPWVVYIVRCADGSYYTGVARDLAARIGDHNRGTGARYTRGRGPVTVVYAESAPDRSAAQRREASIKRMSRRAKERLAAAPERSAPP
jgi:putative endonuclease